MTLKEVFLLPLQVIWSFVEAFFVWLVGHPSKDIKGQVLLITGGGQGIGRSLALGFAKKGAKIVILDVNDKASEETTRLVSENGAFCRWYHCDVSKKAEVSKVARLVRDEVGQVEILINNAGIYNAKYFLDLSESDIRKIMDINILAYLWTVQEFLPAMMERNEGHIINISSVAGQYGTALMVDYCTTKFGVHGFGEALKAELRRFKKKILVTTVYPAGVRTPLLENQSHRIFLKNMGKSKLMEPEELASAVVKGSLKNKEYIYVPSAAKLLIAMINNFPYKTLDLLGISEIGMHEK